VVMLLQAWQLASGPGRVFMMRDTHTHTHARTHARMHVNVRLIHKTFRYTTYTNTRIRTRTCNYTDMLQTHMHIAQIDTPMSKFRQIHTRKWAKSTMLINMYVCVQPEYHVNVRMCTTSPSQFMCIFYSSQKHVNTIHYTTTHTYFTCSLNMYLCMFIKHVHVCVCVCVRVHEICACAQFSMCAHNNRGTERQLFKTWIKTQLKKIPACLCGYCVRACVRVCVGVRACVYVCVLCNLHLHTHSYSP
jgi:hypothetical protein